MVKLFVPEPDINLYVDGFGPHDELGRKAQGLQLSKLVEKIEDPMVIALDGQWGSGKSVFLKCWVGEHLKCPERKAEPIYFDAFENDYLQDPLVALIGIIEDRIEAQTEKSFNKKSLDALKKHSPKLAKFFFNLALAAATGGISAMMELLIPDESKEVGAVDAAQGALDYSSKQLANFWNAEKERRDALKGFRAALKELAAETKLVIVVDELDRCRPDFALSMLEIAKHLFSVPNVHFIFGINLEATKGMVQKRYGPYESGLYLHKFFTITLSLPFDDANSQKSTLEKYLKFQAEKFELNDTELLSFMLEAAQRHKHMNLRTINKVISEALLFQALQQPTFSGPTAEMYMRLACVIVKQIEPELFYQIGQNETSFNRLITIFDCKPIGLNDDFQFANNNFNAPFLYDIFSFFTRPENFENLTNSNWYPRSIGTGQQADSNSQAVEYFKRNILNPLKDFPKIEFN